MKKKFLTLSIIMLLITALLTVNSYAAEINSAKVTITPSKDEYKSGETIEFTVSLKDLQASSGILGLGAYLDYDANLLTLNRVATGLSGWTDADVSEKTNRFATTKNSHSANNEDILVLKFTAKTVSSDTVTSVGLKKIQISNGSEYDIDEVKSSNITIKPSTGTDTPDNPSNPNSPSNPGSTDTPNNQDNPTNPNTPSNPTNSNNPDNSSNSGNSGNSGNSSNSGNNNGSQNSTDNSNNSGNSSSSSSQNNKDSNPPSIIPALGVEELYLPVFISIVAVIALIFFIKIRIIDNKINKEKNDILDKGDKN